MKKIIPSIEELESSAKIKKDSRSTGKKICVNGEELFLMSGDDFNKKRPEPKWGYLHFDDTRKVLKRGKWKVGKRGDISYDGRYDIEKSRLTESNWIIHLMEKSWFDFNEFMPIYLQALRNAGIKEVTILAFYK